MKRLQRLSVNYTQKFMTGLNLECICVYVVIHLFENDGSLFGIVLNFLRLEALMKHIVGCVWWWLNRQLWEWFIRFLTCTFPPSHTICFINLLYSTVIIDDSRLAIKFNSKYVARVLLWRTCFRGNFHKTFFPFDNQEEFLEKITKTIFVLGHWFPSFCSFIWNCTSPING